MSVFGGAKYISFGSNLTIPNYASRVFVLVATDTGLAVTLPTPSALGGPHIYVFNNGSNTFTVNGLSVVQNTLVTGVYGSSGWKATARTSGSMATTVTPTGLGYVIGGVTYIGVSQSWGPNLPASKTVSYDYLTNTWIYRADINLKGWGIAVGAIGDDLYQANPLRGPYGIPQAGVTFAINSQKFTQATNTWAAQTQLSAYYAANMAEGLASKWYLFGYNATILASGSPIMYPIVYDAAAQTWDESAYTGITPPGHPHNNGASASLIGTEYKAYIYGGNDVTSGGPSITNTLDMFDSEVAGVWTSGTPSSTSRMLMGAAYDDGVIYFAGGVGLNAQNIPDYINPITTHEGYSISLNTWSTETVLPAAKWGKGAFGGLGDTLIYWVGGAEGFGSGSSTDDMQSYEPSGNTWATLPTDYPEVTGVADICNSSVTGTI